MDPLNSKTNIDDSDDHVGGSGISRAAKVEAAVSHAIDLVRVFSERDPHDGDARNPWKDPQNMLDQLDKAREAIVLASSAAVAEDSVATASNNTNKKMMDENDFRVCYMDLVTNAFADVLEDMRNNNNNSSGTSEEMDVDILVDCLQSGMDFLSGEEQEFLMMDSNYDDDDLLLLDQQKQQEDGPAMASKTAHEKRQLQLGIYQEVH